MSDRGDETLGEPAELPARESPVDRLYRDQAPGLRRRLKARVRSAEDASDIVQDAFARLLRAAAQQRLRQPEAFLNRIVRNLLIDRARRAALRPPHVAIDQDAEPAMAPDQSDGIEVDQLRDRYRAAVAALPPRMREVFLLHRVDGLGYAQIADRLAISVRTVEWHFAEAIVRIGRELDVP